MSVERKIKQLRIGNDAKKILLYLFSENLKLQREISWLKSTLVSTSQACEMLGCTRKKFWKMAKSDGFPNAVKLGKSNYYRLEKVLAIKDKTDF